MGKTYEQRSSEERTIIADMVRMIGGEAGAAENPMSSSAKRK